MKLAVATLVLLHLMCVDLAITQKPEEDLRKPLPASQNNQKYPHRGRNLFAFQRRYPAQPGSITKNNNNNNNRWYTNYDRTGIRGRNKVPPGPIRYPNNRRFHAHPSHSARSYQQFDQRRLGGWVYRPPPRYPNSPHGPGYIPAYRPRSSQPYDRRYPGSQQRFNFQQLQRSQSWPPLRNRDSWGSWGPWSPCSRTCDGGVRTRTRSCQSKKKPVKFSLHRAAESTVNHGNCQGSPHDFQPCSTRLCTSQKSFQDQKYESRLHQCSAFNDKNYLGKKYSWVPYIRAKLAECKLYCMAKGHRMFVELASRVKDGTPCGEDGTEACFHGECTKHRPPPRKAKPVAQQKSEATRALEGSEQKPQSRPRSEVKFVEKLITGFFNKTDNLKVGYNTIFKIPLGSTNVKVAEAKPSRNYLALKVGGRYIVNGGWQIDLSKEIEAAGTVIRYKITRGQYSTESFTARGPVQREIEVQLLYQEEIPAIVYNYTLKVPDVTKVKENDVAHAPSENVAARGSHAQHEWRISSMTPCSAPCGGGEQEFLYRCTTISTDRRPEFVSDYYCGHSSPPRSKRMCNLHPCPSRWVALQWKPCTKTCGRGNVQLRDIRCRKLTKRNGKAAEINVPISQCDIQTRPAVQRECPYRPCYRRWKTGEWSVCSKSCDKGVQEREIHCVDENGYELHYDACDPLKKPLRRKSCNERACQPTWHGDKWSECSKSCDKGVQERQLHCVNEDGFKLSHDACDPDRKPSQRRPCNNHPCQPLWFANKWSECSTQCGEGIQRRIVFCAGVGGSAVPNSYCNRNKMPFETRKCKVGNCKGVWLSSSWGKCSSLCGQGVQSRVIICAVIENGKFVEASSSECNAAEHPKDKQKCYPAPCSDTVWFMTPWGDCSVKCGTGVQKRRVTCLTSDGHAGRGCQLEEKPVEVQRCEALNCGARKKSSAALQTIIGARTEERKAPTQSKELGVSVYKPTDKMQTDEDNHVQSRGRTTVRPMVRTSYGKFWKSAKVASNDKGIRDENDHENHIKQSSRLATSEKNPTQRTYSSKTSKDSTLYKPETTATILTTKNTAFPILKKSTSSKIKQIQNPQKGTCKDEKSGHYCKVILRLQFCKFTIYRKRCCDSCRKQKFS